MKQRACKQVMMAVFLVCAVCMMGFRAMAAEPKVLVSDYKVSTGQVVSGKEFTLSLVLKNTATKKVKNLKLTVSSEDGSILPAKGAGCDYIEEIGAQEEVTFDFSMQAIHGLEEKSYKMTVKIEYEDTSSMSYTVSDEIYLPVKVEQRLSITDVITDEVNIGDETEIMARINNLGEGMLYNVTAKVSGENVENQTSYVGNIESGKSGMVDLLTKTTHVSGQDYYQNQLIISYEDKQGNEYSETVEFTPVVIDVDYSDLTIVKEATKKDGKMEQILFIVGISCVVILLLGISIIRHNKKKKRLEEF